jgi:hypothetical protein
VRITPICRSVVLQRHSSNAIALAAAAACDALLHVALLSSG